MRRLAPWLLSLVALGILACERDPDWKVSTAGVGPIGLDVSLDEESLSRLFPGLRVVTVDPGEDAAGSEAFRVSRGEEALLDVWVYADGKVSRANVLSPRIPSAAGPKVGDDLQALAAVGPGLVCMTGPENPWVSCSVKDLPRVFFAFDATGLKVSEVRAVTPAELQDRRVRQIWFFGRVMK